MKTYNQPQTDTMPVRLKTNVCSTPGGDPGGGGTAPARAAHATNLYI